MDDHNQAQSKFNNISLSANFLLTLGFWLIAIASLVPMLLVLSVSLSDENAVVQHGYSLWPREFTTYAYEYLFKDYAKIFKGYGVSILVTIVGTMLSLLFTAMVAYPLSRKDFKWRNTFSFFIFFTMLFNGGLVPFYMTYSAAGLKNTLLALILPLLIAPFNVIVMRVFFTNTIPPALIESSIIDGAGEFRIFRSIILPLSLPVLATIGLFQTFAYWNDWFLSLIFISNDNLVNLQYLMYKVMREVEYLNSGVVDASRLGELQKNLPSQTVRMAMAIVGIGPIIFVYPFLQKYFIKGLTVGSVKG
ncbi:sugar ABC transporter permease [Paenibacillus pectinilyticus]|uniref:Sugar ABC transporter permease n=1 Tax=Paenibacillus pectinilyticus TaxID=512399 RepID=A0A1C1A3K0_9BACL|nr:carbohydrate ABC transporter permease [Paenibacillus pectinilyticus]OCT15133.1 sugar ABC transporter permease [Paenibacillus pectinilyticus]